MYWQRIVAIFLTGLIFSSMTSSAAERKGKPTTSAESLSKTSEYIPNMATAVFAKVSKSVVIVEAQTLTGKVQGSGVIIFNNSSTGGETLDSLFSFAVSNAHVIKDASSVFVLQGRNRYKADVLYLDDEFDLALLSVNGVILPYSLPDYAAQLKVGEKVFAIGSPFGLENTISEGIISGKREKNGVLFLQTTAPISKGNSGGGLFDTEGRFVGVTSFKIVGGENLNFAVDARHVDRIMVAHLVARFLRTIADATSQFSPGEKGIINSNALIGWLIRLKNSDKDLPFQLLSRWTEISTDKIAQHAKIREEGLPLLARFLSDQGGNSVNIQNKPDIVRLVCTLISSGEAQYQHDKSFELDYTNKTVNGYPAVFTDAEVRWKQTTEDTEYFFILNRYSGAILIGNKRFPNLFSGHCSQAAERKF